MVYAPASNWLHYLAEYKSKFPTIEAVAGLWSDNTSDIQVGRDG
jgi:hypothetical protein